MRGYITADDIANEVRMTRSQYSGCFLIVEGETADLRLYGRFIDRDVCQLVPAHGKENALAALQKLENETFGGVLAIVDADFWHLEGQQPASSNLHLTDTHDLETMIMKSPALEKLLIEFGSSKKMERFIQSRGKKTIEALLENGCYLGYLRWLSLKRKLSLTFEGLAFHRFVNEKAFTLSVREMVKTVKRKSQRHDLNEKDLEIAVLEMRESGHDPWQVCSGHDLVHLLSLGLRHVFGSNQAQQVDPELLERFLRGAYETAYFLETKLFRSLETWQAMNPPFRVFPTPRKANAHSSIANQSDSLDP